MRALPLAVSAVTVTSALGAGVAAHAAALRERRGGLRRERLHGIAARDLDRARRRAWNSIGVPESLPTSTAATTASPGWRFGRTGSSTPSPRPGRVTAATASRCWSAHPLPASARRRTPTAALASDGSLPASLKDPVLHVGALARSLRPGRAGARGHLHDGRDRLLVERQGVRAGRAADPGRTRRCRGRRRRRFALRQRVCSASIRSNSSRRNPAGRLTSHGAESASARRAASRCSSARAAVPGCWATANRATRTTCRRRIPKASAHASRFATRSRVPGSRPPTSATSICTARRAHATTRSRRLSSPECFRHRPRPARPRAGPATRSARRVFSRPRSASPPWKAAARPAC